MSQHHQVFHVYLITSHHVSICLIRFFYVSSCLITSHERLTMSHHVSSCITMTHQTLLPYHDSSGLNTFHQVYDVSSCLNMSQHVSSRLIRCHHVSSCLNIIRFFMSNHVSSRLVMSQQVSLFLNRFHPLFHVIMSQHVSSCLITSMSHQGFPCQHVSSCLIVSHRVSTCLIMPHQASPCLIMFQHVSSYLFWSRLSSHPFNRIPVHRIISFVFISHHLIHPFPSFSAVIPLQPREKSYSIA